MMTFFPIPYEDELLYSILARYCIASGNISAKSALDDIYGNRKVTAVMDLPAHIDNLISNMPLSNEFTSDELIEKHTLYPFYSAFIPTERAETIKNYMKGNKGGSIYNKIGLMASSITMNHYFKFCPLCVKEDLEKYGCLYWHRIHQITGILICPSHKVLLQDSKVPVRGLKKHEYIAATEDNCKESSKVVDISDKDLEVLESIVEDITLLVDSKYTHKPLVWFKTQYMNALMKKGLANINGSIKQKELITSFVDYAHRTISCSHPCQSRYDGIRPPLNCGYCYPCIIRRASMNKINYDESALYNPSYSLSKDFVDRYSNIDGKASDFRAILLSLKNYIDNEGDENYLNYILLKHGILTKDELESYKRVYCESMKEIYQMIKAEDEKNDGRIIEYLGLNQDVEEVV